jgi:hypothetical protein
MRAARASAGALAALCLLAPPTGAQEPSPAPPPAPAEEEPRSTGLPRRLDWTFNFDAGAGAFGFLNSLYTDPRPEQPTGGLSDNWFESWAKPALTGAYTSAKSAWTLFGKVSSVGERTFAAPPTLVGDDASSFHVEDLHLGWRSGALLGSRDLVEVVVGRAPYQLGHGMLLYDGAAEGGTRGGYWSNARKAFAFAAIARVKPGRHTLEAFYLDKDDLPEADSATRLFGANYELALGEDSVIGATYLGVLARPLASARRDGMDVFNLRVFVTPIPSVPGLTFEGEYAKEKNGDRLDADAWNAQLAYQLSSAWKPKLSYRYAYFEGDFPETAVSEAFDPLLTGFHDWGAWWQGEIAGEYFVANSNLVSHQVRLHVTPAEAVGTGLILYRFLADEPGALAPGLTDRDVAFEADWYMDVELNANFTVSVVGAYANPGKVVEQLYGRRKDFGYGMVHLAYSY